MGSMDGMKTNMRLMLKSVQLCSKTVEENGKHPVKMVMTPLSSPYPGKHSTNSKNTTILLRLHDSILMQHIFLLPD